MVVEGSREGISWGQQFYVMIGVVSQESAQMMNSTEPHTHIVSNISAYPPLSLGICSNSCPLSW